MARAGGLYFGYTKCQIARECILGLAIRMRSIAPEKQESWRRAAIEWLEREPQQPTDRGRVIVRIHEEAGIRLNDSELNQFLFGVTLERIALARKVPTERSRKQDLTEFYRAHDSLVIGTIIGLMLVGIVSYLVHLDERERAELRRAQVAAEQAVRDEERRQAQVRLDGLRELTKVGKTLGNVRVQSTREQDRIRVTVWNDSLHPIGRVTLRLVDQQRAKKIQGERYNGIPLSEMGQRMNPNWLRATGHYQRMAEFREETHQYLEMSGPIRPRYYLQKVVDIPTVMQRATEISVSVEAVWGADTMQWSSPSEEMFAEAMAR